MEDCRMCKERSDKSFDQKYHIPIASNLLSLWLGHAGTLVTLNGGLLGVQNVGSISLLFQDRISINFEV